MMYAARIAGMIVLLGFGSIAYGQDVTMNPTSATDHGVRIHKTRRVNSEARATERKGKSLKTRKERRGAGKAGDARVYKRHRHFADRDIKTRSRLKHVRKANLGVGSE